MMSVTEIFFWIIVIILIWQIVIRIGRKVWHFPAPSFIGGFLDSDFRRWIQPPDLLLSRSGIEPGMTVLEVGCGSCCFTPFAVKMAGPEGKVIGFYIQKEMLDQCSEKETELPELVQADASNLPFCENTFDAVYMVTVLQEIPDPHAALMECRRVLKKGGVLGVSEFLVDPDYPLKRTTIAMGENAGFVVDGVEGGFWNYTVRFRKP
ncbi:class I SAM-dependent methyltransferase [Methanolacinia petrolearia]|uniref:class I SAM-dependent methyltransferase n=1 Tax=Methanolacinia petrolearia TaxID=54120 RepID=UPI003BACFF49